MKPTGAAVKVFRDLPGGVPPGHRRRQRGVRRTRETEGTTGPRLTFRFPGATESTLCARLRTPPGRAGVLISGRTSGEGPDRSSWICGQVLGVLALLCVMNLWAAATVDLACELWDVHRTWATGWGDLAVPLGLYGAHAFGVPGAYLTGGERSLGVLAIVLVWLSFLLGLPFGYIFG